LSIIKHVTLQKIVAHDFQYDPCTFRCVYSIVECLCGKPNWWLGISLFVFFFSITGRSIVKRSFQRLFIQWGGDLLVNRMLTHEVSLVSGWGLFGLLFIVLGTTLLLRTALNNWVRYWIPIVGRSLRILLVIRSYPGDFLGCMLLTTAWFFWGSWLVIQVGRGFLGFGRVLLFHWGCVLKGGVEKLVSGD
jgi:hypothetical protein